MASTLNILDTDVEADCSVDSSETDLDLPPTGYGTHDVMGVIPRSSKLNPNPQDFGIVSRKAPDARQTVVKLAVNGNLPNFSSKLSQPVTTGSERFEVYQATRDICDYMIEDGAHVVFDWDNTLKLYNKETRQLSCRVSKQFLLHLKHDRHCHQYIISAIRPTALNLDTILSEVDRLGLTDVFVDDSCDTVDGTETGASVVKTGEYAQKGNIIICGYDKAETFLKLSSFDSSRGDKVMFFDDEVVNVNNFSALVPNSTCYLCE